MAKPGQGNVREDEAIKGLVSVKSTEVILKA